MPLYTPDPVIGSAVQAWDADVDALAALASAGLIARTGAGTAAVRTLTGTSNQVSVSNGDGVSGNPTFSLPQNVHTAAGPTFATLTLSGLTSGRVPLVSTAGLLIDSASITYSGGVLTATGFTGALNGTLGATTPNTAVVTSLTASISANGLAGDIVNTDATNGFGVRIRSNGTAAARYAFKVSSIDDATEYLRVSTATGSVGALTFPSIGTTASAANAFLDSGASNNLLRSTSSLRYKSVISELGLEEARNIVLNAKAIRFHSLCTHDNPLAEHVGFGAEDIAIVDDRFITRDEDGLPDWVQYPVFVAPLCRMVADLHARLIQAEALIAEISPLVKRK